MLYANDYFESPEWQLKEKISIAERIRINIENDEHITFHYSLTPYGASIHAKLCNATKEQCLKIVKEELTILIEELKQITHIPKV